MVEINLTFPFIHRRKPYEASHGPGYKRESEKGAVATRRRWTDRQPHPVNMGSYDKWANDAEANIAFNVLTDIIAGVGYHTEMAEKANSKHENKKVIDEYGETINLDEDLAEIVLTMLQKGFCPVERLGDYDLKILPPETFYIYKNRKGKLLKYTQEYTIGSPINKWEGNELNDIIPFFHRKTTSWPYGKSLTEPIGALLDDRAKMNRDMPTAIHRWAYPMAIMETEGSKDALEEQVTERDVDEWIYIGNVREGEVRWKTIDINPQARFIPYIELIYYQICEGLHAPLLLYLKNATEASATVMMESVDRLVNGIQRYIKRRVESRLFEPQVGEPVPRLVWGQPKTGLEEIALADIALLYSSGAIKFNQVQDLLSKLGVDLVKPEEPVSPPPAQQPQMQPQTQFPPMEQVLDRLNDLATSLNVIERNYSAKQLSLIEAVRMGDKAISVHLKRALSGDGAGYEAQRSQEFERWIRRLMGPTFSYGKKYEVIVPETQH